jgi:hypothetical protein
MYESARHRLLELLSHEKEAKEQISHLAAIVEQLKNQPLAISS